MANQDRGNQNRNPNQSQPKFRVGDVVKLVSGGPSLTVIDLSVRGDVQYQWFVGGELMMGWSPDHALVVAEPGYGGDEDDD